MQITEKTETLPSSPGLLKLQCLQVALGAGCSVSFGSLVWGRLQVTAYLKSNLVKLPDHWLVVLERGSLGAPRCWRDGDRGSQGGIERTDSSSSLEKG